MIDPVVTLQKFFIREVLKDASFFHRKVFFVVLKTIQNN
jgi:hypothetical protein